MPHLAFQFFVSDLQHRAAASAGARPEQACSDRFVALLLCDYAVDSIEQYLLDMNRFSALELGNFLVEVLCWFPALQQTHSTICDSLTRPEQP